MNRILIGTIVLLLVLAVGDYCWFRNEPPCLEPASTMSDFDKLAFQLLADMNKYLISLATLLLGGLGAVGMKFHTLSNGEDRLHARNTLSVAGAFAIASLYFAFISHVRVAEAAINDCTDFESKLRAAQYVQFATLAVGLIATLYLMFRFLGYKRNEQE